MFSTLVEEYCKGTKGVDAIINWPPDPATGAGRPTAVQSFWTLPPYAMSRGQLHKRGINRLEGEKPTTPPKRPPQCGSLGRYRL